MIQCATCELIHTDPLSCPDCDHRVLLAAQSAESRPRRDRQNEARKQARRREKEAAA